MKRRILLGIACMATVLAVALGSQGLAQVKGKTRPLTTKQLMGGLVKPQLVALNEAFKGDGPADAKAWSTAATQAALLNESAHVMMADGRCPDEAWSSACKMLEEGTRNALARIEAKDLSGVRQVLGGLTASCATCHKVHHKS